MQTVQNQSFFSDFSDEELKKLESWLKNPIKRYRFLRIVNLALSSAIKELKEEQIQKEEKSRIKKILNRIGLM